VESMKLISSNCQAVPDGERGIVVALDISKDSITYRACRPGAATRPVKVSQDMNGFGKLSSALEQFSNESYDVWVGYEPTGPYSCCVLEYLAENGWHVVQINPKHTSRFNDIRDNKPGKDDPRDPLGIAGLIWQGCYRIPLHLTGVYAELRAASAEWGMLSKESTMLKNQLHAMLELWFPELRSVFKSGLCKSACAIAKKYASVEAICSAGLAGVRGVLNKASSGRAGFRAEALLNAARGSKALRNGQKTRHRTILNHLARLELIEAQKAVLKSEMERMLLDLPESQRILSVAGMGVISTTLLIGECGNLKDYSVKQLEKLVGLNLCEFSSGRHKGKLKISKCGRSSVRYALCMAATQMMRKTGIYHDVAEDMRSNGKRSGEIRVAVARKLLRLLHALACGAQGFDRQQFVARRGTGDDQVIHQDGPALAAA